MKKVKVGILGATGAVGQRFVSLLSEHPWFEVNFLLASQKSSGKFYKKAVRWILDQDLPVNIGDLKVYSFDDVSKNKELIKDLFLVFSGLDSSVALDIEKYFANEGIHVVSNSKNHRMEKYIPLLIPEINYEHIKLIYSQDTKGKIITNPNCSTTFFTLIAGILNKKWPIDSISVTTMQAISGAGYPGVASYDIFDNVIPFIPGEEEKMESEPLKILGKFEKNGINYSDIKISASANRVGVIDGHLESVFINFKDIKPSIEQIKNELKNFNSPLFDLELPSAHRKPIRVFDDFNRPQSRLDRNFLNGMGVNVGRIRKDNIFDVKMTILGHNTIKGAAGGAVLNSELLLKELLLVNIY